MRLLIFTVLVFISLGLFSRGFFLTKRIIVEKSGCDEVVRGPRSEEGVGRGPCEAAPMSPFRRVAVLVIDALRADMLQGGAGSADDVDGVDSRPWQRLVRVAALANEAPSLVRRTSMFVAAPTVTAQRLRSLATGSLPTFIEASANFGGAGDAMSLETDEAPDSLLPLPRAPAAFVGDDTWLTLYPTAFSYAMPYDSFLVTDLHTVDQGVMGHFPALLTAPEYSLVVGHCLGVDHAGHRFGPDSPAMFAKLAEMDDFILSLYEALPDDTLLVVMGDHGMTLGGDHGGASPDETDAGLLLMSTRHPLPPVRDGPVPLRQIDLTPTLAALLGWPIPYGNLGMVMDTVIADDALALEVLQGNVRQVLRYLRHYEEATGTFGEETVAALEAAAAREGDTIVGCRRVLRDALSMCQEKWATFDLPLMTAGIVLALVTVAAALATWPWCPTSAFLFAGHCYGLLSNSFIEADATVAAYLAGSLFVAAALHPNAVQVRPGLLALAVLVRGSQWLGPASFKAGDTQATQYLLCLGLLAALIATTRARTRPFVRHASLALLAATALTVAAPTHLWPAKAVYVGTSILIVFTGLAAAEALLVLAAGLFPLALGPGGLPTLVLALAAARVLRVAAAHHVPRSLLHVLLYFFGIHLYFLSGHDYTLSTIQWNAAFVVFSSLHYGAAAVLVVANTFAGYLLVLLTAASLPPSGRRSPIALVVLATAQLAVTMAFVAVQRRHLMVWRVFAPKFMFDAMRAIVFLLVLGLGIAYRRVSRRTSRPGSTLGTPADADWKGEE